MPFPLAHPAAVLPLRRFCPRWLDFSALVIGSLVPDVAYACDGVLVSFFHLADLSLWTHFSHLADLSHQFIIGALGFDLPVGLVIWLVTFGICRWVIGWLPGRCRDLVEPCCRLPTGFPWTIAASVLIGAWTHLLLDSLTHPDGWFVGHWAVLQQSVPWVGHRWVPVFDLLYYGITFFGSGWLALAYLSWREANSKPSNPLWRRARQGCAWLLALSTLALAEASRGGHPQFGLFGTACLSIIAVLIFLGVTTISCDQSSKQGGSNSRAE